MPVLDIHTGFPYSLVNEAREFVGPRNDHRFRDFNSFDLQAYRQFRLPFTKERKVKVGFGDLQPVQSRQSERRAKRPGQPTFRRVF